MLRLRFITPDLLNVVDCKLSRTRIECQSWCSRRVRLHRWVCDACALQVTDLSLLIGGKLELIASIILSAGDELGLGLVIGLLAL